MRNGVRRLLQRGRRLHAGNDAFSCFPCAIFLSSAVAVQSCCCCIVAFMFFLQGRVGCAGSDQPSPGLTIIFSLRMYFFELSLFVYVYIYIYIFLRVIIHTYIHTHIHTYTYIYIYIYIYI